MHHCKTVILQDLNFTQHYNKVKREIHWPIRVNQEAMRVAFMLVIQEKYTLMQSYRCNPTVMVSHFRENISKKAAVTAKNSNNKNTTY